MANPFRWKFGTPLFFFMPHFIRFKGCIKTTFRLNLLCFCMLNILFWYLMFGITHLKCS